MTIEQAFFDWWDKPGRPSIINHRIAFEAGYRAAPCGGNAELRRAAQRALNYITNTESEFGVTLECGDMLRSALASVDRSPEGQDPQGLDAKHESAVPKGDAQ